MITALVLARGGPVTTSETLMSWWIDVASPVITQAIHQAVPVGLLAA